MYSYSMCNVKYTSISFLSIDINECATGDHTCDVNADCSNTNGSFTCSCIIGYSGDGMTCNGLYNFSHL